MLLAVVVLASCTTARPASERAAPRATAEPLRYTIRVPAAGSQTVDVDVVVPTERRDSVVPNADPAGAWTLEVRPDATPAQTAHFAAALAHSSAP